MTDRSEKPASNQENPASHSKERGGRSRKLEDAASAAIMSLLSLITLVNAATRYFGNLSLAFTEEISVFLIVLMTLIGAASAFTRNRHLAVTLLVERLSPRGRDRFHKLALACSLVMFGLLVWYGAQAAWDDFTSGVTSQALDLPQWLYSMWIPLICAVSVVKLTGMLLSRGGN